MQFNKQFDGNEYLLSVTKRFGDTTAGKSIGCIYSVNVGRAEGPELDTFSYIGGVSNFHFTYWYMGQCGNVGLHSFSGNLRPTHNDEIAKWILECIESVIDVIDSWHKETRQYTMNLTFHNRNNTPLVEYILSQTDCKPVHTYRNTAHHPYTQCTWYAWHKGDKRLPDEWGIDYKDIPYQEN